MRRDRARSLGWMWSVAFMGSVAMLGAGIFNSRSSSIEALTAVSFVPYLRGRPAA